MQHTIFQLWSNFNNFVTGIQHLANIKPMQVYMLTIAMQVCICVAGCSKRGSFCYATPAKSNTAINKPSSKT